MWELDQKEGWVLNNWCLRFVMLAKTLESPLDCKEVQPVHPKGDQFWVFIGRTDVKDETPVLWPPDAKSWLTGKDPDAGKDWGQEKQGTTEDEMVGWYYRLLMDREAWLAAVFVFTKSWTWLSRWTELNLRFISSSSVFESPDLRVINDVKQKELH